MKITSTRAHRSTLILAGLTFAWGCAQPLDDPTIAAPVEQLPAAANAPAKHAAGTQTEPSADRKHAVTAQPIASAQDTVKVLWNAPGEQAPQRLTLLAPGFERVANGPSAIAVASDGERLLLDGLSGRVMTVSASGGVRVVANVAHDAERLASASSGFAVMSPLRGKVWLHDRDGAARGELTVGRELREVTGIALGSSRRVWARNAYQELLPLGSPTQPNTTRAALRGKREGAALLADGRGVSSVVRDGHAELLVTRQALAGGTSVGHERSSVAARWSLGEGVTAARVIGVQGQLACARLERVSQPNDELMVDREAVCVDVRSGLQTLRIALGRPGVYLPNTELAMGPAALHFMLPDEQGLTLYRWSYTKVEGSP